MISVTELIGQRAVSLTDAEEKGKVTGLRFEGDRVTELDVKGRLIQASQVRTFAGGTVTFDDDDRVFAEPQAGTDRSAEVDVDIADRPVAAGADDTAAPDEPAVPPIFGRRPFVGSPVGKILLTDTGNALGTVADMELDDDGRVVQILDEAGGVYDGANLRAVGSYAVVVRDDTPGA
jgi:uncharacterized protein YrrD